MTGDGEKLLGEIGSSYGRVLDRDLFFFLLDLEVKRSRRYQNFLCLMLLKIRPYSTNDNGEKRDTYYRVLSDILKEETRDSDIIGSLEENRLAVLLPYADSKAGDHVKSRFENTLQYYDVKEREFEIIFDQVCFPINGANTMDFIKRALSSDPS
jgi:GGDEF domain-containing protein